MNYVAKIIMMLEKELNNTKIDNYNDYTFMESRVRIKSLRKIIQMIKDFDYGEE